MKFIHLSDTHLKKEKIHLYGLDPYNRLETAINSINKNHKDADFVVITGDLTDKGHKEAYKNLDEILSKCDIEVIKMIGNHDIRENFLEIFPDNFQNEGFIQGTKIVDNKAFIFLDTKIPKGHGGDMCEKRFSWFEKELEVNKDKEVYIFMHHPPFDIEIEYMDSIGFGSNERLKKLLSKYSNVKHLFFGHVHRVISGIWGNIPYFGIKGTNHQVALKSDENLFMACEEKPAYGVVTIHNDNTLIHVHEFLTEESISMFEA